LGRRLVFLVLDGAHQGASHGGSGRRHGRARLHAPHLFDGMFPRR
jgi:hypothetical protein